MSDILQEFLYQNHIEKMNLEQIKKRIIITDENDLVASTWLKFHPSLGKSDEVVWVYEFVREEFKFKIMYNIPLVNPIPKSYS